MSTCALQATADPQQLAAADTDSLPASPGLSAGQAPPHGLPTEPRLCLPLAKAGAQGAVPPGAQQAQRGQAAGLDLLTPRQASEQQQAADAWVSAQQGSLPSSYGGPGESDHLQQLEHLQVCLNEGDFNWGCFYWFFRPGTVLGSPMACSVLLTSTPLRQRRGGCAALPLPACMPACAFRLLHPPPRPTPAPVSRRPLAPVAQTSSFSTLLQSTRRRSRLVWIPLPASWVADPSVPAPCRACHPDAGNHATDPFQCGSTLRSAVHADAFPLPP